MYLRPQDNALLSMFLTEVSPFDQNVVRLLCLIGADHLILIVKEKPQIY